MRQCKYGVYAIRDPKSNDIHVLCDPTVDAPLEMEIPVYEDNCKMSMKDVNKGECLGVCPLCEYDYDMDDILQRDQNNEMIRFILKLTLGMTDQEINETVENITDEQIEQAIEEGVKYATTSEK